MFFMPLVPTSLYSKIQKEENKNEHYVHNKYQVFVVGICSKIYF